MTSHNALGDVLPISRTLNQAGQREQSAEFIDSAGRYGFRAYLNDAPPDGRANEIVADALAQIAAEQDGLSNDQLYDQLHARLCGPEPLEREPLLTFMKLCIIAIQNAIRNESHKAALAKLPVETLKDTLPQDQPIRLSLASLHPQEMLCFLQAIDEVTTSSVKSGLILQLAEIIGCTDREISQLLDTTTQKVATRLVDARNMIWKAYLRQFPSELP